EARIVAEQADHRHSLIGAYWALGEVHMTRGAVSEAVDALERALGLCREWEVPLVRPACLSALGYTYVLSGRVDQGMSPLREPLDVAVTEDLYRQTRALAAELDMQPLIGHVDLGLALLFRRCGRYAEARAHLMAASAVYMERRMPLFHERAETEARALGTAER